MNIVPRESFKPARASDFATRNEPRHPAPRWLAAIVATSLSAGMLMAAIVPGWIGANHGPANARSSNSIVTTPSTDALPLYELPPITVVADRKAELARIERDEQLMHVKQARSKTAVKPPV